MFRQDRNGFDGINLRAQRRQYRRLIAGARADLQHLFARLRIQLLRHIRHDVRLGNRLVVPDRARMIAIRIGKRTKRLRNKKMAGNLRHHIKHPLIANPVAFPKKLHHFPAFLRPDCFTLLHGTLRELPFQGSEKSKSQFSQSKIIRLRDAFFFSCNRPVIRH